jgi:phosphoglycolate phosphatase-like HAD superfamily hydrolase
MDYTSMIFDMDGTLVDRHQRFVPACTRVILALMGKPLSDEEVASYLSVEPETARREILKGWGLDPNEFGAHWTSEPILKELKQHLHVFPDIRALTRLKYAGKMLGLVTKSMPKYTELKLEILSDVLEERSVFDTVVTVDWRAGDRKREGIKQCVAQLEVPAQECLYVGNETSDADEAQAAGIDCVLVRRPGYALPPDARTIDSLEELMAYQ